MSTRPASAAGRARRRLARLLPAVLLVAVAAGCSSPTPSLTPALSGAPEASASTAPGGGLDFLLAALTERIRAGLAQQGTFVSALSTASVESPVPSGAVPLSLIARTMSNWVATERQWIGGHPAEPCYAAVQARYAEGVEAIAASAAAFARVGGGTPDASGDSAATGVTALTEARSIFVDANAQATAAAAACSTGPG